MMSDSMLDRLVGEVVKRVNPLRIVLFGSAARDESGEQSDIDLLVVMPEGVHRRRTAQKLYREIKGLRVPFDIVVATAQDLEKHKDNDGLIYKNALKEGIEVYGL
ncbi:MAG: nucleotidyltransferase domain-containing protein [Candidatus Latescibacteria bacterium]|nr:nucleotidyltransferase domain-containing protein [Candidatus Latescibacterota bacterium]